MSHSPQSLFGLIQPMLVVASYIQIDMGLPILFIAFYSQHDIACFMFFFFNLCFLGEKKTQNLKNSGELSNVKHTSVPNTQSW